MAHRHAMLEEIREQEKLLSTLLSRRKEVTADFVARCRRRPFRKIILTGNGSPYYAGYALRFAAEKLLKAEAEAIPAGIFHHHMTFDVSGQFRPEEILLVCPAESGRSRGQVDAARRAKAEGICVMSTTLNPRGILARTTDIVLAKPGKHEAAVASTKGQTMALFLIFLNFLEAARALGTITQEEYARYLSACEELPGHVADTIEDTIAWFGANEERVMGAKKYFLLGYGANFGTVQEAALKFFECHRKPTISLELEESLHGPLRALEKTDMVFFLAAEDCPERERMYRLAEAIEPYCENRVLIQGRDNPAEGDRLRIHSSDVEFVDAIEYLIPLQVLSYLIADKLDIDLSVPLVASLDGTMLPAYEDA